MPLLAVVQLTKRFGGLTAVDSVDLQIEPGELKGLIGPNGSGKTTLFNVINGLYKPDHGEVEFKDKRITGLPLHAIAQRGIGRTFQNIQLCHDMTVVENVMIGAHRGTAGGFAGRLPQLVELRERKDAHREKVLECLDFVGLDVPEETLARNLPYGHQRLLEIARALAGDPDLILLDEPAAGLNISEQHSLIQLVRRIQKRGIAVLLVEHNMRVVMGVCKVIAVLNYGKKIVEGSPDEIRNNTEVIEAYLGPGIQTNQFLSGGT